MMTTVTLNGQTYDADAVGILMDPDLREELHFAFDWTADDLVLCRRADGWSLHAPGSTDDDIASGDAPCLVSGEGEPTADDYTAALEQMFLDAYCEAHERKFGEEFVVN